MKKQILSEEFKRMQKLAGIITEIKINKGGIVSFLNSNMSELERKIGPIPGHKFELTFGEDNKATAGTDEYNGIDISFTKDNLIEDDYNEINSTIISGKTIYYIDYRSEEDENNEDDW